MIVAHVLVTTSVQHPYGASFVQLRNSSESFVQLRNSSEVLYRQTGYRWGRRVPCFEPPRSSTTDLTAATINQMWQVKHTAATTGAPTAQDTTTPNR